MARGRSPLTKRLEIVPVRCHALAGRGQQRFGACAGSAITTVTGTNPSTDSTERTPKIVWGKPRTASPRAHGAVAVGRWAGLGSGHPEIRRAFALTPGPSAAGSAAPRSARSSKRKSPAREATLGGAKGYGPQQRKRVKSRCELGTILS